MANRAMVGKDPVPPPRSRAWPVLPADRPDMRHHVVHLRRRQQLILAEGGHQRLARGVMTGIADAVGDRLLDGSQIAAPQPVVVIEVGIALRPCGPRPMALDAMHPERAAPALDRQSTRP